MTTPEGVDVLAVMRASAARERMEPGCGYQAARMDKARAAVAELVAKAENAATILQNVINAGQIGAGYQSNLDDLRAALRAFPEAS